MYPIRKFDLIAGEGSFSTVYLAECRAEKGGWVAIKVVEKCNLLKTKKIPNPYESPKKSEDEEDEDDFVSRSMMEQNSREIMRLVDKEIRIMSALDHPHIIHLEEVFEDENRVCFVMELAQGGEVFDRLVEKVNYLDNFKAFLGLFIWCNFGSLQDTRLCILCKRTFCKLEHLPIL